MEKIQGLFKVVTTDTPTSEIGRLFKWKDGSSGKEAYGEFGIFDYRGHATFERMKGGAGFQPETMPQHMHVISTNAVLPKEWYVDFQGNVVRQNANTSKLDEAGADIWYAKIEASTDKTLGVPLISDTVVGWYNECNGEYDMILMDIIQKTVCPKGELCVNKLTGKDCPDELEEMFLPDVFETDYATIEGKEYKTDGKDLSELTGKSDMISGILIWGKNTFNKKDGLDVGEITIGSPCSGKSNIQEHLLKTGGGDRAIEIQDEMGVYNNPEALKKLNERMQERLGFTSDLQKEFLEKNIPNPAIGMMILDWYYDGNGWTRLDNPNIKYVVLSGDPMYGMQIPKEVPYINHLPDAEKVFDELMESEKCAVLYKLTTLGMELVKSDTKL